LPDPRCVGSQTVLLKGPVRLPLPVQPHLGTVKAYMSMLASSQSSRTTYGGNARWRASTPPRRGGVYKGRKPRIKSEEVRRLRKEAWVATAIATEARRRPGDVCRVLQIWAGEHPHTTTRARKLIADPHQRCYARLWPRKRSPRSSWSSAPITAGP